MQDLVNTLLTLAKGMWKFRWPALAVAWLVAIVGVTAVFRVPDVYEASARIYVDTASILKPLMAGLTVQPNVDQQVAMLSRTLITRPNVEKLVRMADLDLKADSKVRQDALVDSLMKTLVIQSTSRDNIYTAAFRDPSPDRAKRVVQSLVSIFVESSLGATRKDTDSAKVFIGEQIKNYEAKLQEAEARLKEFRLRNIDIQTAGGQDSAARLGEISGQLEQAKLELREAENARDAAKAQLASEQSQTANLTTQSLLQESATAVATPDLDARIDAQKRGLDNLLQRYTERHPDIVGTRRLIKDLEEQKQKEVQKLRQAAMNAPMPTGRANNSLVFQELTRILATSEIQVATLRTRVAEYSARYATAKAMLKTSPQLDAEASQLNRDYAINKKNYEDLISRRQSAIMSGELDVASGVADFRLIDPPRVSPRPVAPNRPLLFMTVLLASIAAGLATAFVASQLRPVFHKAGELRDRVDLPLLGVVSLIMSDADRRREKARLVRFLVASGSLIGVFLVGLFAMSLIAPRVVG
jgi:polysaccharide chain length determinant protein (PEP-CTERM system associated)